MPNSPAALPINKAAQLANQIIKGIETSTAPLIQAAIIAAVPDLGLPVVKQIIDEVESILENAITKYIETGADFIIIDTQVSSENAAVVAAKAALDQAIASGDSAAIIAARRVLTNAEDALTSDDGSATPQ